MGPNADTMNTCARRSGTLIRICSRRWYPADARATDKPQRSLSGAFLTGNIRSESERAWQAAMQRVLDESDIVIPAHDFRIPMRVPEQWFAIPDSTEGDLAHVAPLDAAGHMVA